MNMLRAFIAIELTPDIRRAIARCSDALQKTAARPAVRWVPAENIHLTLKFLGDVSPTNVDNLKQMLDLEAKQHPGFEIQIGTLGCFPNPRHPRVLWVGLQAPAGLNALQRGIESAAEKLGYPREDRPFSPHLTIGRVREGAPAAELQTLRAALETSQVGNLGTMNVETVHLFKSDLKPGGAVYACLHTAKLAQ